MIACPNCGGNVKFDIPSQQLACEYCHGLFDPYSFDAKTSDAEEQTDEYDVTVFTCPQCGGELLSTDNAAAAFCSFCGASTILYSHMTKQKKPGYIIPFTKTKEDCKKAYQEKLGRAWFAPKAFKDPAFIDGFRGIYMPYWAYYFTQQGPVNFEGEQSHRSGDYIITDHYALGGDLDAYYKGISFDASSSFADNLSEAVAPFDVKGMKKFTAGYLSGFYADTADVDAQIYFPEAQSIAVSNTLSQIDRTPAYHNITIKDLGNQNAASLHTETTSIDSTMFPVWFMSYRNKDRVAYATVNGQTGKVVVDLPIDVKKYLLGSLIGMVPLFALLCLLPTMGPTIVLLVTGILALVGMIIYTVLLSKIASEQSEEADRGMLSKTNPSKAVSKSYNLGHQKQAKVKTKSKSGTGAILVTIFVAVYFISIFAGIGSSLLGVISSSVTASHPILWSILGIGMIITFVIGRGKMDAIPGKESMVGYIATAVAFLIGLILNVVNPPYDYFYYGSAILCMLAIFLNMRDVIDYYNVLSTRRLPQFDQKQGGDDRA